MESDALDDVVPDPLMESDGSRKDSGSNRQVRAACKLTHKTVLVPEHGRDDLCKRMLAAVRMASGHLPACCESDGFVYIVGAAGLAKIGKSAGPAGRLSMLQASCPVPLVLIAIGRGADAEFDLHVRFMLSRRHGEWFDADPVREWLAGKPKDTCIGCHARPASRKARTP